MVTPSSIFSQYKQKQPASKLRWLFLWYFYSAIFCGFWCILTLGFMLQNTTFIKITISKTTAIATQNPISIPKNSVVSNRFIQILPSSSKSPPFKAALHSDVHTPFSGWLQAPYKAGYMESDMQNKKQEVLQIPTLPQMV